MVFACYGPSTHHSYHNHSLLTRYHITTHLTSYYSSFSAFFSYTADQGSQIEFVIYDFAGQEEYAHFHAQFFSSSSICVLVISLSEFEVSTSYYYYPSFLSFLFLDLI